MLTSSVIRRKCTVGDSTNSKIFNLSLKVDIMTQEYLGQHKKILIFTSFYAE